MKKVLFVNPKFPIQHPPLGIGYLSSYVKKYYPNRFSFSLIDYAVQNDSDLLQRLNQDTPDIVAVSSTTNTFNEAKRIAGLVKQQCSVPVIIGGVHISAVPEDICHSFFDVGVIGEGEQTFLELLKRYHDEGQLISENIRGIAYQSDNRLIQTEPRELIRDLDTIPIPDYSLFRMKDFYTRPRALAHGFFAKGASMMPSRGCPYSDCSFCGSDILWKRRVRYFSAKRVFQEMDYLVKTYDLNSIIFLDDNFTTNRKWLKELCEYIVNSNFHEKFKFDCESIAEFIDEEKMKLLKQMGCERIEFGFESGSPRVLASLKNKRASVSKSSRAIDLCNQFDIKVLGNFIFGWFDETLQEIEETERFIEQHTIDFTAWHTLACYPGTKAWEIFKERFIKNYGNLPVASLYDIDTTCARIFLNDHISQEQAKRRYEDLASRAKDKNIHIIHDQGLSQDDRNVLIDAFKNFVVSHSLKSPKFYFTSKTTNVISHKTFSHVTSRPEEPAALEGILFDDNRVRIDQRAPFVGGSWQGRTPDGITPRAWDNQLVKFFFEKCAEYEQPFVVDIGANTGTFSLLGVLNPDIRGWSFEPSPEIYEILSSNLALNGLNHRVKAWPFALSEKTGKAILKFPRSGRDSGLACIGSPKRFREWIEFEVETHTLDQLVAQHMPEKIDIIKIDTEGCELFVLMGAINTIHQYQPDILLEVSKENTKQFGYEPGVLVRILEAWGYEGRWVSRDDMFFRHPYRRAGQEKCLVNEDQAEIDKMRMSKSDYAAIFSEWLRKIELDTDRLYYRDQSVASLENLVSAVQDYKPSRIIELGTCSGLSLRAWLLSDPGIKVTSVDLSFKPLKESQQILPMDLSRVELVQTDILKLNFAELMRNEGPTILYIDAHDMPGVNIMEHVLNNAVPVLPDGSLMMVDDLWHSQEKLDAEGAHDFFMKTVINEIDPLQCFEGYFAPYWKGGSFMGFREVIPLMEWVNHHKVELKYQQESKSVWFPTDSINFRAFQN